MKKILLIHVFLIFLSLFLLGQEEYFVQLNPATCNYTILDSIPGVKWIGNGSSVFDKKNRRYVFIGQDVSSKNFLYSIDATNGNIVFNPKVPIGNQFSDLRFDNTSGILYGLHWTGVIANVDFVSVNPSNFNFTIIDTIPNITGLNYDTAIDEINHRFIFSGSDSSGTNCLFSIDIATGHIISKPKFPILKSPGALTFLQFDNSSGNLYGLQSYNNSKSKVYFSSVNPSTGTSTIIDSIPYDLSGGISMGSPTFDEINKRYTFSASDGNNKQYLYTIDATNGHVISNPAFPTFTSPYNLLETKYDNSSGNLYALHWGAYSEINAGIKEQSQNEVITIYPNPTSGVFSIKSNYSEKQTLQIFDMSGRMVLKQTIFGITETAIDASDLTQGVYIISLASAVERINKRLVILK